LQSYDDLKILFDDRSRKDKGSLPYIPDGWLARRCQGIPDIAKIGLLSTTVQSTKGMQYAGTGYRPEFYD